MLKNMFADVKSTADTALGESDMISQQLSQWLDTLLDELPDEEEATVIDSGNNNTVY